MKIDNWQSIQGRFLSNSIRHFNFLSIAYAPLMRFLPVTISHKILKILWSMDNHLMNVPVLSKYAFKTVACFRTINKNA